MAGHTGPAFRRPECKLFPAINDFSAARPKDVDARDEPGHDDGE